MEQLKKWIDVANRAQLRELAKGAKTSTGYINQIINGHRKLSVGKAMLIVESANAIREESGNDSFPLLSQGVLHPVCSRCQFFKQGACNGSNEQ